MRIKDFNRTVSTGVSKGSSLKVKSEKETSGPEESVDLSSLYTKEPSSREERISRSLAKTGITASQYTRDFSMAFVGTAIGSAVGSSLGYGGPIISGAVGSAVGAIGGMLWENYDLSGKIGSLFKKIRHKDDKEEVKQEAGSKDGNNPAGEAGKIFSSELMTPSPEVSPSSGQEKGKVTDTIKGGTEGLAKTMRAFPSFVYPSICNATEAERAMIIKTLDSLPLSTVTTTPSITVADLSQMEAAGVCYRRIFANPIELDKMEIANELWGKQTLIHELGHSKDFSYGIKGVVGNASGKAPWGSPPYVFEPAMDIPGEPPYAATNKFEDFAQSHAFYELKPEELKATSVEKYEAMKKIAEPTPLDKLMDKTGLREAGKKIGETIEKVPGLRTTLEVAGTIMGPLEIRKGAKNMGEGLEEGNSVKKFHGKMNLASGILFSSKTLSPFGLLVSGEHFILNRKLKKGKITPETANKWADTTLGIAGGPVAMTAMATIKQLVGDRPVDMHGGEPPEAIKSLGGYIPSIADPGGKMKAGELIGTFAGGAGGAALGAAMGIASGGILGGVMGGVVGAPIGVMAGSLAGSAVQKLVEGKKKEEENYLKFFGAKKEKSELTKSDKIYMGKVTGGSVLGGVAGTFTGSQLGGIAGTALGGVIGGPVGATVGNWVGKTGLGLTGAYYGATLGGTLAKKLPWGEED